MPPSWRKSNDDSVKFSQHPVISDNDPNAYWSADCWKSTLDCSVMGHFEFRCKQR
jgi:hypothetical protein